MSAGLEEILLLHPLPEFFVGFEVFVKIVGTVPLALVNRVFTAHLRARVVDRAAVRVQIEKLALRVNHQVPLLLFNIHRNVLVREHPQQVIVVSL